MVELNELRLIGIFQILIVNCTRYQLIWHCLHINLIDSRIMIWIWLCLLNLCSTYWLGNLHCYNLCWCFGAIFFTSPFKNLAKVAWWVYWKVLVTKVLSLFFTFVCILYKDFVWLVCYNICMIIWGTVVQKSTGYLVSQYIQLRFKKNVL